ncbi:tripartite tricarboxylate transporter TctB family protein [Halomonas huangheensis]|uniref:DUF1468 domain-containing protein n=1 Tax=Halomonas huangheensis TaxID=1178482 RepID=W1NAS1_9GAMM|nr:tripartite tricarboxylate transporter TctB family protein [Halomonas huangheensis]ALM54014.1 hypothetical protein AR456_18345 [Halomonas huangheensis]ERL52020.1 hypothetical protein BJB45_08645 [Halomonas huangheensis]
MQRDIGKPLFDLVLLIASAAAFALSTTLQNVEIVGDLSPSFFPKLISGLIFLFAIPCLIKDIREWRAAGGGDADGERLGSARGLAQWVLIVALTVGYILIFEAFGYIPSTALFAFCSVIGLAIVSGTWQEMGATARLKAVLMAVVFAVILAVVIFYVFTELFEIPLPD